jgi:RNA polymerase sigma-70 factor (ECF subfamily)
MEGFQCTEQWISKDWILERYDLYKTMLFRIAFSYLGNKHDCEDILQEAFIRLYYYAPAFPGKEDEKRWIIRVTINLCKNHLRSFWYRNKVNIEDLEEFAFEQADTEGLQEILKLPKKYNIVIHLHYIEGYKISEIAEILNLTESTVKMRLKRGRELLRNELEGVYEIRKI